MNSLARKILMTLVLLLGLSSNRPERDGFHPLRTHPERTGPAVRDVPVDDHDCRGFLASAEKRGTKRWRPHGDSNPGYRRERAMS
jgi:hypothetical protein